MRELHFTIQVDMNYYLVISAIWNLNCTTSNKTKFFEVAPYDKLLEDAYCYDDIRPGNICSGDICPYQPPFFSVCFVFPKGQ